MEWMGAAAAMGAAVAVACHALISRERQRRMAGDLAAGIGLSATVACRAGVGGEMPLSVIGRMLPPSVCRRLALLLVHTGLEDRMSVSRLATEGISAGLACAVAAWALFGVGMVPICMAGAAAGCLFTVCAIYRRKAQRCLMMERALPPVLDMLSLSVEAGMDFGNALSRIVSERAGGALHDELARTVGDMRVGITRRDALKQLARRVPTVSMRSFVSALVQADRLGSSVGCILRMQADRSRAERVAMAERRAALAAQKMLFPLVCCIMPVTFIVVFGPLAARYIEEGLAGLM